jgi:hypothetical protein
MTLLEILVTIDFGMNWLMRKLDSMPHILLALLPSLSRLCLNSLSVVSMITLVNSFIRLCSHLQHWVEMSLEDAIKCSKLELAIKSNPVFFENVVKQIDYLISEAKYGPL